MFSFFYFVTCKNKAYCSTKYNFFNLNFLQMAPLKFWFIYYLLFFFLFTLHLLFPVELTLWDCTMGRPPSSPLTMMNKFIKYDDITIFSL